MAMHLHELKFQQLQSVEIKTEPKLAEIDLRLAKLKAIAIDPLDRDVIELLERAIALTPREIECINATRATLRQSITVGYAPKP